MVTEKDNFIIKKVWKNKNTGYKAVSLPKDGVFEAGDYVIVRKLKKEELGENDTGNK